VSERVQRDLKLLGCLFLGDEFGKFHCVSSARTFVNSGKMMRSNAFIGHTGRLGEDGKNSEIKSLRIYFWIFSCLLTNEFGEVCSLLAVKAISQFVQSVETLLRVT